MISLLIDEVLPLALRYGPVAIDAVKRLIGAVRDDPSTPEEDKALLDAAEARLDDALRRVAEAPDIQ